MKRFRIITAASLALIAIMVIGNVWYLSRLYDSIKVQTLNIVKECVRQADIREIIYRLCTVRPGDDSFITLVIKAQGEKGANGKYEYPNIMKKFSQTMSEYFHTVEGLDQKLPPRNYTTLDSIFKSELNGYGLLPEESFILPTDHVSYTLIRDH
ncbi:MAG: hypothetical protein K2H76_09985, partial [Muribaculaceae bacterium]|nr:hypothetical protein [Muribaculaceae bacterium]